MQSIINLKKCNYTLLNKRIVDNHLLNGEEMI